MTTRTLYFFTSCLSFSLGFFLYLTIETLYKRHISHSNTHWSMGLLAGLVFLFLLFLDKTSLLFWQKAALGMVFITAGELLFGLYLNLYRGLDIWDYSHLPLHLFGQICPSFSLLWLVFSCAVLWINRFLLWEIKFLLDIN